VAKIKVKKVLFFMAQNDLGGHTRFTVNMIGELQKLNVQCVMYVPIFSHFYYTTNILRDGKSPKRQVRFFIGHLLRSKFFSKSGASAKLMIGGESILIKRYFLAPKKRVLTKFDKIFTSSHWQVSELENAGYWDRSKLIHILHHVHTEQSEEIETYFKDGSLCVFASSNITRENCEELGIRVTATIPLGVRVDKDFTKSFEAIRDNNRNATSSPTVTFFYYNHERKNPNLTKNIVTKLINETNFNVVILGNGFKGIKNTKRLTVCNNATDKEYFGMVSQSDLFVYISRNEGFGLAPLEAMSLGVPTLASCVGAIPEYGRDEENLFIVSLAVSPELVIERIIENLSDRKNLEKIIEAGFKTSQEYSISLTAQKYLSYINR